MSTSTLLDVCNEAFRAIGERPVLTLNTVQGDRVKDCVKQALRDVEAMNTWDFLLVRAIALSWSGNTATLPTYQRLFTVSVGDAAKGFKDLLYVPPTQFDRMPVTPYTGVTDQADYYTMISSGVQLSTYPADVTSQGRIRFTYQEPLTFPSSDSSVFPNLPEKYVPLLTKKVSYLMALRYLDDPQSASYFQQEFEQLVQQYRNYERNTPINRPSMFRRGR